MVCVDVFGCEGVESGGKTLLRNWVLREVGDAEEDEKHFCMF